MIVLSKRRLPIIVDVSIPAPGANIWYQSPKKESGGAVEDTGWSHPPWPKRVCDGDQGEAMASSGKIGTCDGGRLLKETTTMGVWSMLTRTNYVEWALLMQVNLEAMEVWQSINPGTSPRKNDRMALGALLRGVPQEMWSILAKKKTVKEAWEAVRNMRIGSDHVKMANAQRLMMLFKNITFKEGEMVDEFGLRIESLAESLWALGENLTDARVVKKMMRVLPKRFSQITALIETLLDVNTMLVEDLVSRLKSSEDRIVVEEITEQTGCLMLMQEEWPSKYHHCLHGESSSTSGGDRAGGSNPAKQKSGGGKKDPVVKLTTEGAPRRKGRCRNCGIYSHWKQDCKRPKKDRREESHHVQTEALEQPALLLATVNTVHVDQSPCGVKLVTQQVMHLNEEKVYLQDRGEDKDSWVLDTGASNHMTGWREAHMSLDTSVHGTVRFGDGSLVEIEGIGSIML
jgi:hypothetical protein